MLENIILDLKSKTHIYLQIAEVITFQIDEGILPEGTILPSINVFNEKYNVARDTVEKAYKELKKNGYIDSVRGKGYFVNRKRDTKLKILFILNKISSFKKIIYYSFLNALGSDATVDLQIHHYNPLLLKEIIEQNLGKYNYYIIMPHFEISFSLESYLDIIKLVPKKQLMLLDKNIPSYPVSKSVYQDFKNDSYDALINVKELTAKYKSLVLLFPEDSNHPLEIIEGIKAFSNENKHSFKLVSKTTSVKLIKDSVYVVLSDDDLIILIKKIRQTDYVIGKDIGILSFNETDIKDLLDITTISTDFDKMGRTAAELIISNSNKNIRNPFRIIKRCSL